MNHLAYGVALATLAVSVLVMGVFVGHAVPVKAPLQDLPFQISRWTGRTELIEEAYIRRARPDEFVARRYADARGPNLVLYVGYYRRQASRGQIQAVCYGDCKVTGRGIEQIPGVSGAGTVNRAEVNWDGVRTAVLYWYQQGGRITSDPYRGKLEQARRVLRSRRSDGALIRVAVPIVTTEYDAREQGLAFASALIPLLGQYLPE